MAYQKRTDKKEGSGEFFGVAGFWPNRAGTGYNGRFNRDLTAFTAAVKQYGFEGLKLLLLENNFKKSERDPSYKLIAVENKPYEGKREEAPTSVVTSASKPVAQKLPWE